MQSTAPAERAGTAIPPRYNAQRERVLRILNRWESTIRSARLSDATTPSPFPRLGFAARS